MKLLERIKYLFFDRSFVVFLLVGVLNTIIGLIISYGSYNLLHVGFWTATVLEYFIGSIVSYFLNKRFAFHYQATDWASIAKFALNVVVCYIIAFPIARPLTAWLLGLCVSPLAAIGLDLTQSLIDNVAILSGTVLFTIVNYLGQRFFAFAKDNKL